MASQRLGERGRGGGFRRQDGSSGVLQRLQTNPVFQKSRVADPSSFESVRPRIPLQLLAYDGRGHLFVWNSQEKLLHFVDVQHSDSSRSGNTSNSASLLSKKDFKSVKMNPDVEFSVRHMVFNRTGRTLAIVGDSGLVVLDVVPHLSASSENPTSCRVSRVGGTELFSSKIRSSLRILQLAWHPYSDTHLGVLSTDGVFRLYDLSLDVDNAEQEYHLDAGVPARRGILPLARAVGFAFGGEHLWDRFTVFILFSNGSVYALCPVVPFGSMFNGAVIDELVKDAMHFTLHSSSQDSTVVRNASRALAWLEAVFTGFVVWSDNAGKEPTAGSFMLKAHAHVPLDSSLLLQGPLSIVGSVAKQAENIVYTVVGKDSILGVTGQDSCVHLYGVDDELQPMWNSTAPPRLTVDEDGHIMSVGMLVQVEASREDVVSKTANVDESHNNLGPSSPWTGQPPPLVGLGDVELSLQPPVLSAAPLCLLVDPVVPERLYCYHAAGMDAISLQCLPFSADSSSRIFTGDPHPVVVPLLDTCPGGGIVPQPLLGMVPILDPFGETWLVAVTVQGECAVVEVKPQPTLANPLYIEGEKQNHSSDLEALEAGVFQMMSRELLLGPKDIPISQVTLSGMPLTVDTIEGRTFLHDQCKLLREKYIEYAHRVHVELMSHGTRLHEIVQEQQRLLHQVQEKMKQAQKTTGYLVGRLEKTFENTCQLEQRIKACSSLPSLRQNPLTESEMNFKSELDVMRLQNHEVFHSVIDLLMDRCEQVCQEQRLNSRVVSGSPRRQGVSMGEKAMSGGKQAMPVVAGSQMRHIKVAVEQLVHRVESTISSLTIVDDTLCQRERLLDR